MDAPQGAPGTQGVVMAVSGDVGFHGAARPKHAAIRRLLAGSAGLIAAALPVALWAQATPQIPTREEIQRPATPPAARPSGQIVAIDDRSEEHTSELQSLMRIS